MASMFDRARRPFAAFGRDRAGVVAVVVAICLPVFVALAALAIDMSYAYWVRTQLQHAASAAALAGASRLRVEVNTVNAVKLEAIEYAGKNLDPALHGTVLLAPDVNLGNWNPAARSFTLIGTTGPAGTACSDPVPSETDPACLPIDAVEVTTRKAQVNGNPLNLFLAPAIGLARTDISTVAIASAEPAPPLSGSTVCFEQGMVAGNDVDIQPNNSFANGYCVYGRCEVSIGEDTTFQTVHPLLDSHGNPKLDQRGVPIIVPGTRVAVGPEDLLACDAWRSPTYPGLDLSSEFDGRNCGLLGLCTPSECGPLGPTPEADCAWQGPWRSADANAGAPPPGPELAAHWADNMFPAIENLPSMREPLTSTAGGLGAITSIDLSAYSLTFEPAAGTYGPETHLPADFFDQLDPVTRCQTRQGGVYEVDGTVDLGSNNKICNVVIIADKITSGSGTAFRNVALIARNSVVDGANIDLGPNFKLNRVLLAARNNISLGSDGEMGDRNSCGSIARGVQIFALNDLSVQSGNTIFDADLVSGRDVRMGANLQVNLAGNGTAIQALRNIFIAGNGTYGACPESILADASEEAPEIAVILRLVH